MQIAGRIISSGNAGIGISLDGAGAQANINNSVISHNGTGIFANIGTVRLSNCDISFNTTGISGTTFSFTNSRISGNGAGGTPPVPILPNPSNPTGQQ